MRGEKCWSVVNCEKLVITKEIYDNLSMNNGCVACCIYNMYTIVPNGFVSKFEIRYMYECIRAYFNRGYVHTCKYNR